VSLEPPQTAFVTFAMRPLQRAGHYGDWWVGAPAARDTGIKKYQRSAR